MKTLSKLISIAFILFVFDGYSQCTLNLFANPDPVICGECVTLSAYGSMDGNVAFQEDFNSGSPVGWQFTQATTIANNTCGVPSPDGTDFMWMGDASVNPRDMTTVGFDLTLGGTICFEMRYSIQADASPCEGPDEPDEGVYLQYSTDNGATWITIDYWDPNGGNDPNLTNWNQYCVAIPAGALTTNTMIQWHQDDVSGAEYDHWGIDNVIITLNDPNSQITWLHDGYSYPLGSAGGDNPTQVCISTNTTYTAEITNGTNTCTQDITVNVVNPDVVVSAAPDTSICPGECVQLVGEAKVVTSPASTPTFENNEFSVVASGSADMNINVTGLNQTTLTSSSITEVCLNGFTFSGTQVCSELPPPFGSGTCPCNGGTINSGETCNLDISSFDVILTTPDGCQITLVPNGVATGTDYTNVCFVPSGGADINGGGFPAPGTWDPDQPLSNLNGCNSNGVWNLEVNAPGGLGFGLGTLQGWSISFDDPEISYPATYTWTPTTNMTNSNTLTPTVCPPATETYTLEATDANNCVTVTNDVTVTVAPCTCTISALTANAGACQPATNTYDLTGSITFSSAPATGTLTVTDCNGNNQVFNAPFTSPQAYSLTGLTADGAACDVTAVFSADPTCTMTTNFNAPASCTPSCSISGLTANAGACQPATNTYDLTGSITFTNAPATGTLTVTDCNGNNQVFNAPFTSPQAYSLTGLTADGAACDVTAVFSADAACTSTTNFNAPAACTPNCAVTGLTAVTGACQPATNTYDLTGSITFTNAPATGTLTVTDCNGNNQVFNAPFTSPQAYSLTGLTADGAACDVTAVFSADAACTLTTNFNAPASCSVSCSFTTIEDSVGICDGLTNLFPRYGEVTFTDPPATGLLLFTDCQGVTDTLYPPFTSPANYYMEPNSDGSTNCDITAVFTADPSCTISIPNNYPAGCACSANVGTFTTDVDGVPATNNIKLCYGETFTMTSDGNMVPPDEALAPDIQTGTGDPATSYSPDIGYAIYTCPPTVLPQNALYDNNIPPQPVDPCLVGFTGVFGGSFTEANAFGQPNWAGAFVDNVVYYVPITFYDSGVGYYSYTNTTMNCYSMGAPIAVQYLPEVVSSNPTENCQDSSFTITINGGLPELDGSNFTASNLLPATASFVNTTTTNGGTIQINGLQDGDMYSFDVADSNGCPITVSGGPFVGLPYSNAGVDDTTCTSLSYNLSATPSVGTGSWSGPANVTFAPNVNDPNAIATSTLPGTYSLIWTEDNGGGCTSTDTVDITFSNLSYTVTVVNATCGQSNGTITVNAIDGITPYQYSNDNGVTFQALDSFPNLSTGPYDIVVTDAAGCQVTSLENVQNSNIPVIDSLVGLDPLCNGDLNGEVEVFASGGTGVLQYSIDGGVLQADSVFTGLAGATTYLFTVEDAVGCQDTMSTILIEPTLLVLDSITSTDVVCNGDDDGTINVYATGGTGTLNYSIDNGVTYGVNSNFTGLAPGTYYVWVQDGNNCTVNDSVVIAEPQPLSIPNLVDSVVCFGTATGSVQTLPQGGIAPYTYAWTSSANVGNNESNLPAGNVTVTVTDNNLCTLDSTFVVYEPAQFTYTTDSQNANCNQPDGWAAVVGFAGGTGAYTYQWDVNAGNQVTDTAINLTPGSYDVTITDENLCDTTLTITVGNNPSFTTSITGVINATCDGGSDGEATANGSDPLATYNYLWDANAGNQTTQTATGLDSGIYYVTITDSVTGCFEIDSVVITDPTPVTINSVSPDVTICSGQTTDITATATGGSGTGYVYTWDNGLGTGQTHTVSPAPGSVTIYNVTAVDDNNCPSDVGSVTVTVNPDLSVLMSNDDTICPGAPLNISALASLGNGGPYTYSWTPNSAIDNTGSPNPVVNPTQTTVYYVTINDGCSPAITDSVVVSIHNLPQPLAMADTLSLCEQPVLPVTFYNLTDTTNGMLDTASVIWDFGDGITSNNVNTWDTIQHTYTVPGSYVVSMTVSSTALHGGCTVTDTVIPDITIHPLPTPDFISNPNPTTMFEPEVDFADLTPGNITTYHWDFDGLDSSNYQNPSYQFPDDTSGTYLVTLTVTDANQCENNITKTVIVRGEFGLFVPNAFTPDFDNKNDVFKPKGFGIADEGYSFKIFNRWGEKIYETEDFDEGWDGFYKGTRVQEDTYVWKIIFNDVNGEKHTRHGRVTIIQ